MKHEVYLAEYFGSRLSNGAIALECRVKNIDPYVALCDEIVIDFTGVRNANSSFVNALITGAVEHHGTEVIDKFVFKGCTRTIQVLVKSALYLGEQKAKEALR